MRITDQPLWITSPQGHLHTTTAAPLLPQALWLNVRAFPFSDMLPTGPRQVPDSPRQVPTVPGRSPGDRSCADDCSDIQPSGTTPEANELKLKKLWGSIQTNITMRGKKREEKRLGAGSRPGAPATHRRRGRDGWFPHISASASKKEDAMVCKYNIAIVAALIQMK